MPIPKNPDTKQWDDQDRQAQAQLSPQQKEEWVANRASNSDIDKPKGSETVTAEPNSTAPDLDSTHYPT
jgi:hypothetical protein